MFWAPAPIVGKIEHAGAFPRDVAAEPLPPTEGIWPGSSDRIALRARGSGALDALTMWGETLARVKKGWLGDSIAVDRVGNVATYQNKEVDVAFRFGAQQMDKLRP